jgi:hypothetical protein
MVWKKGPPHGVEEGPTSVNFAHAETFPARHAGADWLLPMIKTLRYPWSTRWGAKFIGSSFTGTRDCALKFGGGF